MQLTISTHCCTVNIDTLWRYSLPPWILKFPITLIEGMSLLL